MITPANISEVLRTIGKEEIRKAIDEAGDNIYLSLSIFNTGYSVHIESVGYCEETEQGAASLGDLYTDKDSFLLLCKEVMNWIF